MEGFAESRMEEGTTSAAAAPAVKRFLSRLRTARTTSSTSLRHKSDESSVACKLPFLFCAQQVILGTRLFFLLPAVPLAAVAVHFCFGDAWVFALSLAGLVPLAERLSFLTEQISMHTGPTAGGLLNATCGNVPELIIALFALRHRKTRLVQRSLAGSVLSNLLLVLGSSLLLGGFKHTQQHFDRRPADDCSALLLLATLCQLLSLLLPRSAALALSRSCSAALLVAYVVYLFFQLKTHRNIFESTLGNEIKNGDHEEEEEEKPVVGFWTALVWLVALTLVVSVLSEYIVGTIEAAAAAWKLSVGFISVILLPIVGNAAEHAGAIIFAYKNKLDITLGVSMGSATQISMFVVPVSVMAAWAMGVDMGFDVELLETASMVGAVIVTAFIVQDGTSHYLKGLVLLLCYFAIGASFFVFGSTTTNASKATDTTIISSSSSTMATGLALA